MGTFLITLARFIRNGVVYYFTQEVLIMKKLFSIFLIIAMLVTVLSPLSSFATEVENSLYRNVRQGFQIAFPENWGDYYHVKEYDDGSIGVIFDGKSQPGQEVEHNVPSFMILPQDRVDAEKDILDSITYLGTAHGTNYYYATGTGYLSLLFDVLADPSLSDEERALVETDFSMQQKIIEESKNICFSEIERISSPTDLDISMEIIITHGENPEPGEGYGSTEGYGLIQAIHKTTGELVWTYQTDVAHLYGAITEISDLHVTDTSVYVAVKQVLYALDRGTGTLKWTSGWVGGTTFIATDKYENVYANGKYGPGLVVYDRNGAELFREDSCIYGAVSSMEVIDDTLTFSKFEGPLEVDISVFWPREISVTVNGKKIEFDQPPVLINDRTLVPIRKVIEAISGHVEWDEKSQSVILTMDHTTVRVVLTIGSTTAYVNGEERILDVPPMLIGDRTLMPIRFIAEAFGFAVDWIEETNTVEITSHPDPYDEFNRYAEALCYVIEKSDSASYFKSVLDQNTLMRTTLMDLDEALKFQENVLHIEGMVFEIGNALLKAKLSLYTGTIKDLLDAGINQVSDIAFELTEKSIPDLPSFIYNIGVTACDRQLNDVTNLIALHSKIKSGNYTNQDSVNYIYLYYQHMINLETSKLSIALLSSEFPDICESFVASGLVAAEVFAPNIVGDIIDFNLNIPQEAFLQIVEQYSKFACGEAHNFFGTMTSCVNHPAVRRWSENVTEYSNMLNNKLSLIGQ